jgi:hypothetical protein
VACVEPGHPGIIGQGQAEQDATRARQAEAAADEIARIRTDNRRLAEKLAEASSTEADPEPVDAPSPRPRTTSRARKAPVTQTPDPKG